MLNIRCASQDDSPHALYHLQIIQHHTRSNPKKRRSSAMKAEYSDTSYTSLYPLTEISAADGAGQLCSTDCKSALIGSKISCEFVADKRRASRQRSLDGHAAAKAAISYRLPPRSMAHPEGHSDQFPAPPKAWECCGCKQKFYNFEKECNFCATLFCKDCKKIPWK